MRGLEWWHSWLREQFEFEHHRGLASPPPRFADSTTGDPTLAWGFWATLLWAVAAMVVATFPLALVFRAWYLGAVHGGSATPSAVAAIGPQILTAVTLVPQVGVLYLAASLKSESAARYLGLRWPQTRYVVIAVLITLALVLLKLAAVAFADDAFLSARFVAAYRTAASMHLLTLYWICITLIGPIGEEIVFRGFVFRGWAEPLGVGWTIVWTSFAWMLLHLPNSLGALISIFLHGLVLGWLRWRSESIVPSAGAHILTNASLMIAAAGSV